MSACDLVVLRGGLTLPLAALRLAWALEARGLHLGVDGDLLRVGPRDLLTDDDRAELRRWKPHLLAMLEYSADAHEAVQ
jgi:hypothetical protein